MPPLPMLLALLLAVGMAFPPGAHGFKPPGHDVLPDFDKRKATPEHPLPAGRAAQVAELANRVPGLRIDFDEIRGAPRRISSREGFLTGPGGEGGAISAKAIGTLPANDPHRALKAFLNEHAALFGHGAEILDSARVKREFVTPHNGLRTTVHEQHLDQITVYEGLLVSHLTRRGELVNLSSQFLPNLDQAAEAGTPNRRALEAAPTISATEAVALAGKTIGEDLPAADVVPAAAQPAGAERRQRLKAGGLPGEAQVKLVWLPMDAATVRLCWQVELTRRTGGERFRVLIDVQNGEALLRRCLTVYLNEATYRVFTSDSPSPLSPCYPSPTTNQPPLVPRSLVTLAALSTNASPLGWIADGENETRGNNVDAHLDLNADDMPDLPRPHGNPFRVFDFPEDLTQPPSAYRDASVVQLFYWCNWMHDQLYDLGFTEGAGNFQKDNFGRGGAGDDALQADAQDGSGVNNSNFTPTDDGESPRIQMYVFTGPSPARDGSLDAEIVLHEYTHGLSTRLVGGGAGISALQTAGMGEGWSDFFALSLLSEPDDNIDGNYALAGYATYQFFGLTENYYYGIRRYPYTTDLAKNPLTFKDIDPAQISPHTGVPISPVDPFNPFYADEVHSQGEVWCVTLWEARANLIRRNGFARGNHLILQLVTDGMKLGPPNPNFLEARDAILQADFVDNGGADFDDLWSAFAKRGMGFSATSPSSGTTAGVREAFDLPDALLINPSTPFISSGPVGGPLLPGCMSYALTNHTSNALSWVAKATQPWLTVSPASGRLAAGAVVNVTVCLSNGGTGLPWGDYHGAVVFSNLTSRAAQRREVHVRAMDFAAAPFVENFESGRLQSYWMATGTGDFRTQVTTNYGPHGGLFHLTMDNQNSGNYARNEVTLGIDLGGYTNVVLRFWAKSFGDEPDGPPPSPFIDGADFDGVAISQDGIAWYEVQGLRDLQATNTEWFVDLDAATAAHGLAYNSTFLVRFNHYDNFAIPTDGIAIDDISITGVAARRLVVTVPRQATEGDGTLSNQGRVTLALPVTADLTVQLASSNTAKVKVPAAVTIPAGAAQAAFDLFIQDNSLLDGTQPVLIAAAAAGYAGQGGIIYVADSERATLKVELPSFARKGDGLLPGAGTVTVSRKPVANITVALSSSDLGEVQVPATVVIPAGRRKAVFDLTIIDNHKLEGTRPATITAHVDDWNDGQGVIQVLDNVSPGVSLLVPAVASESNGMLANAGAVRIPGTLPTNLVFNLFSSNTAKVVLPASVIIPAGSTSAAFNITMIDNAIVDGVQTVTLAAGAPGFGVGTATIQVLDNETPPVPYQPTPAPFARDVALTRGLSWHGGVGKIIVNGGFETGDFTGWIQENADYGSFVINDGTFQPSGPDAPMPPYDGKFSAMTDQIGGGSHTLYQDILIPPDATAATLSWVDRIRNSARQFDDSLQRFRVEIRNPSNDVLALAFTTRPGDPPTNNWVKRSFDLTSFRGQTIRVAFVETDHLGYFNVHLDDVSVILEDPGQTSFDVYFGTNAAPGLGQLLGNTTIQTWPLPSLALNTTYYWRVVGKRGAAQTAGPVWQFTTRGVGALDHFEWSAIPGPQMVNQPFNVTLTAKDDINNTVTNFKGPASVSALAGAGTASAVVITEIDTGTYDKVEFANVSGRLLSLSGWQIVAYDRQSWPSPRVVFTVPTNIFSAAGDVFLLNYSGTNPGVYPDFFTGTNVSWNNAALGNPVAVLLRDAGGNVVDFVCAVDANPAQITNPISIPPEEWLENPIPANTNATLTYQRVGNTDHNNSSDWIIATGTAGQINAGLDLPFLPEHPISLSPASLSNFVAGAWTGELLVQQLLPEMRLLASDGLGHFGLGDPFAVDARNDLAVAVSSSPNLAIIGDDLRFVFTVTNTGPMPATAVILQDALPAGTTLVSATLSRGACAELGGILFCNPDELAAGDSVAVTMVLTATAAGIVTNVMTIDRQEDDGYLPNNTAAAMTAVNLPLLSIIGGPSIRDGASGTTNALFSVRLSAPCKLPVSVHYATSDNTAIAGQDYLATNGTLVFPPGSTNQNLIVQVIGRTIYESSKSYFVSLSSPTNGAIVIGQVRGGILNDDPAPRLFINDVTATEGPAGTTSSVEFTVGLAGLTSLPVSVNYATADGTAVAGSDYIAQSGVLSFDPGVTNQTISVVIMGDNVFKTNATFSITLSNPSGASVGRARGVCTIQDNGAVELDHFVWSLVPSPQYGGVPFIATVTAKDGRNNDMAHFSGTATLKALAGSQAVTVGSSIAAWPYPLGTLYHDSRIQSIYLGGEIGAAGQITALALNVNTPPGQTLSNWTIRLKHTPLAGYTQPAWEAAGWTTVYQQAATVAAPGSVTFFFDTPFDYDGTNNLMVDLSFKNSSYSSDGTCFYTETKPLRSISFQTDSAFGAPLDWTGANSPPPSATNRVPTLRLMVENPVQMVPASPVTFSQGIWSGPIIIQAPASNLFLRVLDGSGHVGAGNLFTVDPAGGLRLVARLINGAAVQLSFATVSGKSYRLERTDDLSANTWTAVADNLVGTGSPIQITDPAAPIQQPRFYRVRLLP